MPLKTIPTKTPPGRSPEAADYWAAHRADPSEATAVALVEQYVPLVRRIVRSMAIYAAPNMDMDDLLQHALLGLWSAINRYEDGRGASFESYAGPRIRGAVRDALRRNDPLSRTDRALFRKVESHTQWHLEQTGTVPDETEIARALEIPVARIHEVTTRAQPWLSLDAVIAGRGDTGSTISFMDTFPDEKAVDAGEEAIRSDDAELFRRAFRRLPDRQQKVLYLYYYEGLTLKEVGAVLDLTEARICQIHAAVLVALRVIMRAEAERGQIGMPGCAAPDQAGRCSL